MDVLFCHMLHETAMGDLKQNQAREVVLRRIRSGDYRPGQRLPSERELAQDLAISHLAVRRGLQELVDAGLIFRQPRVGTFVQKTRPVELSNRLGIVVPPYIGQAHPFLSVLLNGVLSRLDQRDSAVSIFSYTQNDHFWAQAGEPMAARGIQGAVIYTGYIIPEIELKKLEHSGIKAVLLKMVGGGSHSGVSTITIDFRAAMHDALRRLIDLGHRRIAWMCYTESAFESFETDLVADYARQYDLGPVDEMIHRLDCDPWDYHGWDDLLAGENRPTAMVLQDEFMAHEVFRACLRAGLTVPDDLSLVSLADSLPRSHAVPLSAPDTIGTWTDVVHRATDHLLYLLQSGKDRILDMTFHAAIHWKASTGRPRQLATVDSSAP